VRTHHEHQSAALDDKFLTFPHLSWRAFVYGERFPALVMNYLFYVALTTQIEQTRKGLFYAQYFFLNFKLFVILRVKNYIKIILVNT